MAKSDYTYFGYANGWRYTKKPEEVVECEKIHHPLEYKEVGKCVTQVTCHACKYFYNIDSSD